MGWRIWLVAASLFSVPVLAQTEEQNTNEHIECGVGLYSHAPSPLLAAYCTGASSCPLAPLLAAYCTGASSWRRP